jgi:DNA-binding NarL/FixJ family response regulator
LPLRVLVVDDSEPVALGIARFLAKDPRVHVVATGANGREAVEQVARLGPDLVVLDVHMPEMDGLAAAEVVCRHSPQTRILMVSMDGDARIRADAFARGAHGFVPKISLHRQLMSEIRRLFPALDERITP